MNKYLLLRDNKQSGPYSVDELAKHGLKAYDLVWLEGKSAAWRYPSEIAELKPFAPAVEEQPFDRFYKKSETKTTEPVVRDNTGVKENHSFVREEIKKTDTASPEFVEVKINSSKKIHVSLPGKKSPDPVILNSSKEEISSVEKIKPLVQPVLVNEPVLYSVNKTKNNFEVQGNFEEAYKKSKQKESALDKTSANQASVSKLLFRSVAAACLLLGGALIGLIINYNNQQKKFQQLNQLVQEIKHQDNQVSTVPVKNEAIQLKTNVEEVSPPKEEPEYKEEIQLPVTKKDRRDAKSVKQGTADTPVVPPINDSEALSASLKNEEPSEKPDKLSSELARKNLWQLVSVENNAYKTGVFGGISNLSLKLSNKSLYQLEQVEVEIRYLSPEKKIVNKQTVVFENVSPGEQLSLDIPKSGRGVKIDYSIKKINTKEFGIAHAGM